MAFVRALALVTMMLAGVEVASAEPTYNREIVRLLRQHCLECHRRGDVAPFPLETYRDAHAWRAQILDSVKARRMPPWKPVPGFGEFRGVRRLSDAEIALVSRWVEAGAAEGPARDLPPLSRHDDTSKVRIDATLAPETDFEVPANHSDIYRCFSIPTALGGDRQLTRIEVAPGNRKIVHHVLVFMDARGESASLDARDPGLGYKCFGGPGLAYTGVLGAWAPGMGPHVMPPGVATPLPAGARMVMQVHYHNHGGAAERDRTAIKLTFASGPVERRLRSLILANNRLVIPAGAPRHAVSFSFTIPRDRNVHAHSIVPHMHLLGREIEVTAVRPDGKKLPLIRIDDWDFNWQGYYTFTKPVALPGGTRLDVRAVYDNSAGNPRNPSSPPRDVRWGEATTDEMVLVLIRFTDDAERLDARSR